MMDEQADKTSSELSTLRSESQNAEHSNLVQAKSDAIAGQSEVSTQNEQYPLRNASDDPRWAVWTVWIWFSIALFLILFISILIILGLWFD